MDLSTDSRSASASSVSIVSMSAIGSILLLTWMTSSFSKQRTTWVIASTSRMWARNLLPRPSPLAAPATSPAMSTNSTAVGSTLRSEEHTSELQSLMRHSYAVFCLKQKKTQGSRTTSDYIYTDKKI